MTRRHRNIVIVGSAVTLLAVVGLSNLYHSQPPDWPDLPVVGGHELTAAEVSAVESAVRKFIHDPNATFGARSVGTGQYGGIAVCGIVYPSINNFGGYAGPHPYIAAFLPNGPVGVGVSGSQPAARATFYHCKSNGLPLPTPADLSQ
jgi:hypothetical protein